MYDANTIFIWCKLLQLLVPVYLGHDFLSDIMYVYHKKQQNVGHGPFLSHLMESKSET